MEHKSFPITELKAVNTSDEPGTFEAIVAVFGNVDDGGDRLERGAFKRTLKERGFPPIVWSHQWDVPPIGVVSEAVENNEGLRIKGRLFVGEGEDHPLARQVYTAMKAADGNGASPLREFSFGYSAREHTNVTEDDKEIRVLKDVELYEVGPTLVGMNPQTRLMAVKAACEPITIPGQEGKWLLVGEGRNKRYVKTDDALRMVADVINGEKNFTQQEPVDKPKPKPPEGEEARARIDALLHAQPINPRDPQGATP